MKVYKSRRDWIYGSIFLGITLLFAVILVSSYFDTGFGDWLIMFFILGGINSVLLTNFFFIKIKIKDKELIVNIIFDIFRINIFKITKVRIGETMWSGFHKCGTAKGGLIIFSKYKNDLYITPENQDEFLKQLLEINRHIIIEDVRK
ncbi:PH domain-containing protein [Epilithonimonas sp. UC225_85]|uniref:PH domain-containing protein n=1 Tax=Epilithonimonas sp. UC225_85 TaxID=3350167 RepID=UPI0036D2A90C